jgi:3-hydroxyisobutyrate dehydrogenase/2-hydroxy-3-oxopropionate reductase
MTTVGVAGIGRMGGAMSRAIARAGLDLVLYNRTRERAEALADELGARVAATPAELAAGADVVISMVADDAAVRDLYQKPAGMLEGLSARSVAVDMSTVLPDTIRSLADDVRATGAGILDAPVSGSVLVALAGELTIMVGGEAGDLDRARPVLEAMASRIFHMGPLGAGATIKLAVNAIIFGLGGALAEALVLAEKAGVDRTAAYDVFAASAIGAPFVQYKRAAFLAPEDTPTAFSIDLARKDLGLIFVLAERVGADMPQARANDDLLAAAAADVGGDRDFSAVATHLRALGVAGVAPRTS